MKPLRTRAAATVVIALTFGIALAGCSSTTQTGSPGPGGSASSPAGSSAASQSPTESAEPTAPASTPGSSQSSTAPTSSAKLGDPCKVITTSVLGKIIGAKVTKAQGSKVAGSYLCTYATSSISDPIVTVQTAKLVGGLDAMTQYAVSAFADAKVTDISVSGADQAKLVTGKIAGAKAYGVYVAVGGVFQQTLVVSDSKGKDHAVEIATKLAAG